MRIEDRERAMVEVVCRVLAEALAAAAEGRGPSVEQIIHDTLYEERKRLDGESRRNPRRDQDRAFNERLYHRVLHASQEEQKAILREQIEYFVEEVAGKFNPRVYDVATRMVPRGLALLMNALSPGKLLRQLPELPSLDTNVMIRGEVDTLRRLTELGTVILCPTHLSNLDSPVIGWALFALGLPPHLYGAGINLFENPLLSFFMQNLGAFRVDRKKKSVLYKQILKTYSTVALELGYHTLFFPGGTRSRSGAVEPRLKLGLLGCGIRAYVNNLLQKKDQPNIYVVPCTLSYQLVLEAETLIDDYLKETGKARYVIEDDESSRLGSWLKFMSGLVSLASRIFVTISEPLDLFGNRVEADGRSYDRRGRPIDITRYVMRDGVAIQDSGRDYEYTKELGGAVLDAFRRDNVLQSTHLAAFTMFELLRRRHPEMDLYRLLRSAGDDGALPFREVAEATGRVAARAQQLSDDARVRLDPRLRSLKPEEVLTDAVRHFATYHDRPALRRHGDRACPGDMNLLFYYHNRANGYGLADHVDARPVPPRIDLGRRLSGDPLLPSTRRPDSEKLRSPEQPISAEDPIQAGATGARS